MQRVANCILAVDDKVLLLKKPSKGWYSAPGGKMELGESVKETAVREFWEETGLTIHEPELRGTFTFVIKKGEKVVHEWMMFTFFAEEYTGDLLEESQEGKLEWIDKKKIKDLPMAEGDRDIFAHMFNTDEPLFGTFVYTEDRQLLQSKLDPTTPE
ncbi:MULTISPECIES: NUDIX hydrolase [Bacillaceae]|jgi:8-oxo-dGTP diphosphatase|uniref:8-oxo-dGTP diphosphatase n=1 Tax=Terribacillus saccharophilus TaxID=361277 RepID=A0A1H8ES40_9BACI|nr:MULTISPECIES: 8-oxo-dGTP diphosphatase [Bacillaceae]MCM3226466.1 8-oxo-dGTP diphosphatase [Terribacillus saccharophilus]MEC0282233.1 8-oxo-dGTP diphosphatase [Terribacillus saccharophilus]MEC0289008.1 8-oxo-dGTP diphosphatase [Terribacillus saccharophilus]MEC0303055.1 8-oxo-dGTP diphosphatase [Terribacillus saccharophilus]PAD22804.1 8-oxo-dGTP diphosphatase [Terribacillus saccharophilus]